MLTTASQISLLSTDELPTVLPPASEPAAPAPTAADTLRAELKGISLPVMLLTLGSLEPTQIEAALNARFGGNAKRFFDNDPVLLDLAGLNESTAEADWPAVRSQLSAANLQLIGICGGNAALQEKAQAAGIALIDAASIPAGRAAPAPAAPAEEAVETQAEAPAAPSTEAAASEAPTPEAAEQPAPQAAAMVIDKPLRSGQRVYARGGDLVVLAMVSAGAEVIADGNIHIYAPLRGRALAGASGDTKARIFTTSFEAELVSIAGVYRTFESAQQFGQLAQQPVQVSLLHDENEPAAETRLQVAALSTR